MIRVCNDGARGLGRDRCRRGQPVAPFCVRALSVLLARACERTALSEVNASAARVVQQEVELQAALDWLLPHDAACH